MKFRTATFKARISEFSHMYNNEPKDHFILCNFAGRLPDFPDVHKSSGHVAVCNLQDDGIRTFY